MKKLIYIIICVMAAWSCSDISENERFVYIKPADVNRNVLIEDYTGQKCVNCPKAADEINKLQEQYGEEHVIAVSIHGGPMAVKPTAKVLGLGNDLADTYYYAANITANPMGVINRSGEQMTQEKWQSAVSADIQKTAPVEIKPKAAVNNNKIVVELSAMAIDGKVDGKIQAWILEDGIVATQYMPDGSVNKDYVHNHVLRAAVNGDWGEEISLAEGSSKDFKYEIGIDEAWNKANLSLVAFVYNDNGVLQVEKTEVSVVE